MTNLNLEYQDLLNYLTDIMHKLQNQSDILRNKDIAFCLSNDKEHANNAFSDSSSNVIIFGLQYLKNWARKGEDAVAQTIAHELSHLIFREKFHLHGAKEEEIFADNYGLILCHRAGYNVTAPRWMEKVSPEINDDVHPQKQIRQLVLQRTAVKLNSPHRKITPFKVDIPDAANFTEYLDELKNQRKKSIIISSSRQLPTDLLPEEKEQENSDEYSYNDDKKIKFLLSLPSFKKVSRQQIMRIDFNKCTPEDVLNLYQQIEKVPALKNDQYILTMFHAAFTKNSQLLDDTTSYTAILQKLENFFMQKIDETQDDKERQKLTENFLYIDNRFRNPQNRQKLFALKAQDMLCCYGYDDGSDKYARHLKNELNQIARKLHNADVIPLAGEIKQKLKITPSNMHILQNFISNNSFEVQQVRAETLISECLLEPQQALATVKFLTDAKQSAFQFCGKYGSDEKNYSYIDASNLENIRNDWANISPTKRADIFALLMENISPQNCTEKLELFVDKKDDNHDFYKSVMETYLKTYSDNQQPYVVSTLISRKDITRPYSYEDYFKTMLLNSGIVGRRIHDSLYGTDFSKNVQDVHRNYVPLFSDDNIEFANLAKLGKALQSSTNPQSKNLGQQIILHGKPSYRPSQIAPSNFR